MPRDPFHCCVIDNTPRRWFVYFDKSRSMMVVTDSMTAIYEKEVTTKDRIEFAGNVSESLLEHSWQEMVLRRSLRVSNVTEDKLTLIHVIQKIELHRVRNADVQLRTANLLEEAVNAYLLLLERQLRSRNYLEQMAARKTVRIQSDRRPSARQLRNTVEAIMAARKTVRIQSAQRQSERQLRTSLYTVMAARKTMRSQSAQRQEPGEQENGSAPELNKRRRTRPTGLSFAD